MPSSIPKQYQWLEHEPGPRMLKEALAEFGTFEGAGRANNPRILSWAKEVGQTGHKAVANMYLADEIPWCGLFIAVVAARGGKECVKDPLWALNWGTFGSLSQTPMLGDVMVYVRRTADGKKAGHVGLYVGEDDAAYHTLGGNQGDCVCVTRMPKNRLYMARRPKYNQQPPNVRRIVLASSGKLSTNEQ